MKSIEEYFIYGCYKGIYVCNVFHVLPTTLFNEQHSCLISNFKTWSLKKRCMIRTLELQPSVSLSHMFNYNTTTSGRWINISSNISKVVNICLGKMILTVNETPAKLYEHVKNEKQWLKSLWSQIISFNVHMKLWPNWKRRRRWWRQNDTIETHCILFTIVLLRKSNKCWIKLHCYLLHCSCLLPLFHHITLKPNENVRLKTMFNLFNKIY